MPVESRSTRSSRSSTPAQALGEQVAVHLLDLRRERAYEVAELAEPARGGVVVHRLLDRALDRLGQRLLKRRRRLAQLADVRLGAAQDRPQVGRRGPGLGRRRRNRCLPLGAGPVAKLLDAPVELGLGVGDRITLVVLHVASLPPVRVSW